MPKAIQFDKFQEPPPEHGQELHARWRGLRLAAFCIGMASYGQDCKDLKTLENAVADAEVMYKKINEMPGCRAVLLKNPRRKDVMYDHLRHEFLELLVDDLPQVVLVYAAGHGTQMGQDVCLIPVSAKLPDHRGWDDDDCRMNCVSHRKYSDGARMWWMRRHRGSTRRCIIFKSSTFVVTGALIVGLSPTQPKRLFIGHYAFRPRVEVQPWMDRRALEDPSLRP